MALNSDMKRFITGMLILLGVAIAIAGVQLSQGARQERPQPRQVRQPPRSVAPTAANLTSTEVFSHEVLRASTPVLVDFSAVWCGACRELSPTIDTIAQDYTGKVKVVRIDVDQQRALSEKYHVQYLPTLIVFQHGKEQERLIGAVPKAEITKKLDAALLRK